MFVRDILAQVAKIAEGEDFYKDVINKKDFTDKAAEERVNELLTCYNNVIKDVTLNYYEYVRSTNTISSEFAPHSIAETLIKVISVTDEKDNPLPYKVYNGKISVDKGTFKLSYRAIPRNQQLEDNYLFDNTVIKENVLIYGTLAEYMLMHNRLEEALNWEQKYRQAIDFRKDYKSRRMKAGKKWGL